MLFFLGDKSGKIRDFLVNHVFRAICLAENLRYFLWIAEYKNSLFGKPSHLMALLSDIHRTTEKPRKVTKNPREILEILSAKFRNPSKMYHFFAPSKIRKTWQVCGWNKHENMRFCRGIFEFFVPRVSRIFGLHSIFPRKFASLLRISDVIQILYRKSDNFEGFSGNYQIF